MIRKAEIVRSEMLATLAETEAKVAADPTQGGRLTVEQQDRMTATIAHVKALIVGAGDKVVAWDNNDGKGGREVSTAVRSLLRNTSEALRLGQQLPQIPA